MKRKRLAIVGVVVLELVAGASVILAGTFLPPTVIQPPPHSIASHSPDIYLEYAEPLTAPLTLTRHSLAQSALPLAPSRQSPPSSPPVALAMRARCRIDQGR